MKPSAFPLILFCLLFSFNTALAMSFGKALEFQAIQGQHGNSFHIPVFNVNVQKSNPPVRFQSRFGEVTLAEITCKVTKEEDAFTARIEGVIRASGSKGWVAAGLNVEGASGRCGICKGNEKWYGNTEMRSWGYPMPGKEVRFNVVYARLKADVPVGKLPTAPNIKTLYITVGYDTESSR